MLHKALHMHACAYVWMVTDWQRLSIGGVGEEGREEKGRGKGRGGPGETAGGAALGSSVCAHP